jgi:RNA polymerase sigma-70 factor (ECF subfamily)
MSAHPKGRQSASSLLPAVYEELRHLAEVFMRGERPGHTLQPTALVHEAYLRLARDVRIHWGGKTHFVAVAAVQMRRILVDHARKRLAQKRAGRWERVTLDDDVGGSPRATVDILALDRAMLKLRKLDARQGAIAELRLFGGLSEAEMAAHFGLSTKTIRDDWRIARAWLARELAG